MTAVTCSNRLSHQAHCTLQDRTVPFWTKLYNDKEYKTTNRTYQHAFYIPSKYQVCPY